MDLAYHLLDVFTSLPLQGGNPHAVFPDATGLDAEAMQRIARELNLPETSFIILQESSDSRTRVRIFTPDAELPFAGVPTIGAGYVMRAVGIVPRSSKNFVLQENVGDVAVRVDEGEDPVIWLMTPPIEKLGEYPREGCAAMVGLQAEQLVADVPCELLSAGNAFIFIAVDCPAIVDQARLDLAVFEQIVKDRSTPTQVFVFAPTDTGAYSRMFGPQIGVAEDPATGSATGPLALFMMKHGLAQSANGTRFVSEQGTKMGRQSFLHVHVHGERGGGGIDVGGHVAELAKGVMSIPVPSVVTA
jgi:trans-2,3-dihydro-3-hydroxyanthranilate isomerase